MRKRSLISIVLFEIISLILPFYGAQAFYGARYEPPDGTIYHCAQAEVRPAGIFSYHVDWQGIEEYTKAAGNRPKIIMHYISLDPFVYWLVKSSIVEIAEKPYDYIAQIGLDFYKYVPYFDREHPQDITADIARGDYDRRIGELAELLSGMKIPVFLRPGYEFGGNGWGRFAAKNRWTKAWKRIYRIFESKGVRNVAFVWDALDAEDFLDYYPGNDYVDWWGINIFGNRSDSDAFVNRFVKEAMHHKKPVIIAESTPRDVGSIHGARSWQTWYKPYFDLIAKYPDIKAFCYINASWRDFPDPSFQYDSRIQSDPYVAAHYKQMLSSPKFINAGTQVRPKQ
jgi:hypothetical protein